MIKISKENIDSFLHSIVEIEDKERYTLEFWDKIEKNNENLLDMILSFVANFDDVEATMFLDGLWIMYSLIERELELNDLERIRV